MSREVARAQLEAFQVHSAESAAAKSEFLDFFEKHENAASRELTIGHFTASAWVLSLDRKSALLTHHRKLKVWIPLGGHCDGDFDFRRVALKEVHEESGLRDVRLLMEAPIDLRSHRIPAWGEVPEHRHYDVRFLCEADSILPLQICEDESLDLQWISLGNLATYIREEFLLETSARALKIASAIR